MKRKWVFVWIFIWYWKENHLIASIHVYSKQYMPVLVTCSYKWRDHPGRLLRQTAGMSHLGEA